MSRSYFYFICILVVTCAFSVRAQISTFGIGIPSQPMNTKAQLLLPQLVTLLKTIPVPDYCCYDDVGAKNVHLNVQQIAIDQTTVTASMQVNTNPNSFNVDFAGGMKLNYFVRLCYHDDPFGSGCSTLHDCKGNVYAQLSGSGRIPLEITADGNGRLSIIPQEAAFSVIPLVTNMCNDLRLDFDDNLGKINSLAMSAIATYAPFLVADILKYEPQPLVNETDAIAVKWTLDSHTGTTADGVILQGEANILARKHDDMLGPFTARGALPDVSSLIQADTNTMVVALADSVFSNLLWTLYLDQQLDVKVNTTFNGQSVLMELQIEQPPIVVFSALPAPNCSVVVMSGNMSVSDATGTVQQFVATYTITTAVSVIVDSAQTGFLMQLSLADIEVHVTMVHGQPFDPSLLAKFMSTELTETIFPQLNVILSSRPVPLPLFESFTLTAPQVKFVDTALLMQAVIVLKQDQAVGSFADSVRQRMGTIQCPDIPGARADPCLQMQL